MRFSEYIKPYVQEELAKAGARRAQGDAKSAFVHLENAHVLGQASTKWHTIAHWNMLKWGVKNRDGRETVGQILRIIGALTKTALGLVPIGNTGGRHQPL